MKPTKLPYTPHSIFWSAVKRALLTSQLRSSCLVNVYHLDRRLQAYRNLALLFIHYKLDNVPHMSISWSEVRQWHPLNRKALERSLKSFNLLTINPRNVCMSADGSMRTPASWWQFRGFKQSPVSNVFSPFYDCLGIYFIYDSRFLSTEYIVKQNSTFIKRGRSMYFPSTFYSTIK